MGKIGNGGISIVPHSMLSGCCVAQPLNNIRLKHEIRGNFENIFLAALYIIYSVFDIKIMRDYSMVMGVGVVTNLDTNFCCIGFFCVWSL